MKKLMTLALVTVLALSLLTACGDNSSGDNNMPSGSTSTPEENNNTQDGSESNNDSKIEYGEDYILNNLKGDYSITYQISATGEEDESTTITTIRTSEGYYLSSDGSEMLFIKDGVKYYMYSGSTEDGFSKNDYMEFTQDQVEMYFMAVNGYMMMYNAYSSVMKNEGTETVAGRSCDKYSLSYAGYGVAMQYSASIDKETGVCLKWKYAAAAGGELSGVTFECTEFKTSGVSLPDYE